MTRDHDLTHPTSRKVLVRSLSGVMLVFCVLSACSGGETTSPSATPRMNGSSRSVAVTSAACGDVITSDLRLENDLVCAGDGLTVTGSGMRINLNNHTIRGPALASESE